VILDATTLEAAAKLNIGPTIACGESEDLTGLRLLQIRDQWLWEIDCAWRRKLCWLPSECRLPDLYPQMAWQGPYLALTIANGDIVILDIDLLRGGTPIPLDTEEDDDDDLDTGEMSEIEAGIDELEY